MAKTSAQLDREIAAALAKRSRLSSKLPSHLTVPAKRVRNTIRSTGGGSKTLRRIATIVFPKHKGRVSVEVADHVDRHVGVDTGDEGYRDHLLKLSQDLSQDRGPTQLVLIGPTSEGTYRSFLKQPDAYGNVRTEIPFGSVYVSKHVRMGKDAGVTIYFPPIDQETIEVAVDATLQAGKTTPAVREMIENALEGRIAMVSTGLINAYVALVAQLAGALSSAETKVGRY